MNHYFIRVIICAAIVILSCTSIHAKPKLHVGDILNIETASHEILKGQLKKKSDDSLTILVRSHGLQPIAKQEILNIYREKRMTGIGMIIGGAGGLGIGLAWYWGNRHIVTTRDRTSKTNYDLEKLYIPVIIGVVAGGLIGNMSMKLQEIEFDSPSEPNLKFETETSQNPATLPIINISFSF